jgi:hypothetical protein
MKRQWNRRCAGKRAVMLVWDATDIGISKLSDPIVNRQTCSSYFLPVRSCFPASLWMARCLEPLDWSCFRFALYSCGRDSRNSGMLCQYGSVERAGLLRRGWQPNGSTADVNNAWLAWSFQANFMSVQTSLANAFILKLVS